jgi:hypothetical protein
MHHSLLNTLITLTILGERAGLLAGVYLTTALLFSTLGNSRFAAPIFPVTKVPSDHPDQYAREHGLLVDFNRESWTLPQEQCDAAFHPLWQTLYESKIHFDSKGGHTLRQQEAIEKDDAHYLELTCVKIINNTLYLSDFHHMDRGSRTEASISLLERSVITSPEMLPDV